MKAFIQNLKNRIICGSKTMFGALSLVFFVTTIVASVHAQSETLEIDWSKLQLSAEISCAPNVIAVSDATTQYTTTATLLYFLKK